MFTSTVPLTTIYAAEGRILNLFTGMRIVITENRDKSRQFVNGAVGNIERMQNKSVFVRLADQTLLTIYPLFNTNLQQYYPIVAGYSTTIHKAQGKTLDHATLWFDTDIASPGTGYAAVSRVRTLNGL